MFDATALKEDFDEQEEVDSVNVNGDSLTITFNQGVEREEGKPIVESIVFDTHEFSFGEDVHVTSVPEEIRREEKDMKDERYTVIVSSME